MKILRATNIMKEIGKKMGYLHGEVKHQKTIEWYSWMHRTEINRK